jgi:uncharacterized membrane protein SpoIIM required for sporulation
VNAVHQTVRAFRAEREADWLRLEALLDTAETKSLKRLSDEELSALPVLYRHALSSLSVARAVSLDRALVDYLEALCLRAYFFLYGPRQSLWSALGQFARTGWPQAVRALAPDAAFAALLLALGALIGFLLVAADPEWFRSLVPNDLADGRNPDASAESLAAALGGGKASYGMLGTFATFRFTHNAQVAMLVFALGLAFAVPSMVLLVMNGATMGAFLALYAGHGLAGELGGWLAIHGTTELLAIMIAGGAGLHVGRALAFPGAASRLAAATAAGRRAGTAMAGVVAMLAVAGLLEGIGRQAITDTAVRYGIGVSVLALWLVYFARGGRRA